MSPLQRTKTGKVKKHYVLLEILIGLTLAGLLLSFLFRSIFHVVKLEKKIEKVRFELLKREHTQTRLQDLFFSLEPNLPFSIKEGILTASFDQGIDPDPDFSGSVPFTLYLDEKKNLMLQIYASEDREKWRQEILFSNVDTIEFLCLGKEKSLKPLFTWYKIWEEEKKEKPIIMELLVFQDKEPLRFLFAFPQRTIPTYTRSIS